jgi:PKD repeat protein
LKHSTVYGLTCILTILLAAAANATTIVLPTDEQLIAKSPLIVEGSVVSSKAIERGAQIWTETTVTVSKRLKGQSPDTITIREIGGVIVAATGDRITKIFGAPEYHAGEHVLVFLTPTPRGDYQTMDLFVGKFTEEKTIGGQRLWSRHDDAGDVSLLDRNFNELAPSHVQRDAVGFEQFIAGSGDRNYEVQNPVIAPAKRSAIAPDFTLISEPTVYRWARFESGQSAGWYSYGTQPVYAGGGVNELQTAINAWTGFSQALIRYTYVGTTAGPVGGLSGPNGRNEVLFNDPQNDIAGSWNPSTGGVVGVGGFNGVSYSATWNAPFTADATHTQRAYTAYNITEGNLSIQDNVSSSTGISSVVLAEIIAHELGHTLGFGHSTDSTALMYASVTRLGPSLRADDQTAARWLYPNGSSTPPPTTQPPAAPTGLTATASGSTVTLRWSDNATNETGQSIYVASGSGAFSKAADVAAGQITAQLTGFGAGTYRFYVIASNSAGSSAQSNTAQITISASAQAAFTFTPTSGTAGSTTFTFTDQSTGSVSSRAWTFGDGATANGTPVSHVYASAGQYTVSLTINGGQSIAQQVVNVSAGTPALAAEFYWTPTSATTDTNITFVDASSGSPTGWQWNFGDGSTANTRNPVKRYAGPGNYNVTLTASKSGLTSVMSHAISIGAGTPATPNVSAEFTFTSNATVGQSVNFIDQSSGSPTAWLWSFGDGGTAFVQNPTHVYSAPGSYSVTLNAASSGSTSIAAHIINISSNAVPYRSLVSVITQTTGVGGAAWRTELTLFNAGSEPVTPTLIFFPSAGQQFRTTRVYLAPKQSVTYGNALLDIFGVPNGAGALGVEADSVLNSPDLRISSRTYTDGANGTYGQAVGGVAPEDLGTTVYLTGLESDTSFRTNVGLVNRVNAPVGVTLELYDGDGNLLGTKSQNLAANNFQQNALTALFPNAGNGQYPVLSLRMTTGTAGAVSAYASVVDNRTQDPVYIQGGGAPSGGRLVVPVVGRAAGANGTFWRSDVTLYNPRSTSMTVAVRYLPAGSDNRGAAVRNVTIGGNRTTVLPGVLSWAGLSAGSGALDVQWSGGNGPVVTSRTYTTTTEGGTFGQSIDPIAGYGNDVYVPGLRSDFSYRSNVGFVNGNDTTIGVTAQILASNGDVVAQGFVALPPRSQNQMSLTSLFPGINPQLVGSFTLKAHTDGAPVLFAYGSIVDNGSGDPVFFAGR